MEYIKIRFVDYPEAGDSELRKTLDEVLRGGSPRFNLSRHGWRPHVDIYETEESVVVLAEVAGLEREEIQIDIGPRALKISGARAGGPRGEDVRYRLAEIPCGRFERNLALPAQIDTGTAEARYRDGLLEIRLHKRSADTGRVHKINVQGG